jgi:hypothetical protein
MLFHENSVTAHDGSLNAKGAASLATNESGSAGVMGLTLCAALASLPFMLELSNPHNYPIGPRSNEDQTTCDDTNDSSINVGTTAIVLAVPPHRLDGHYLRPSST